MTQTIQSISLAQLRFGHEFPGANINARLHKRTENIDQLAASIAEEGVLHSLHAFQDAEAEKKKLFYVDDGNRRLAALHLLAKKGTIAKDALIPAIVYVGTDPKAALRKSLEAAIQTQQLHPVDQFEAFTECMAKGDTPETISARYALPLKLVKQRLALGALSPVIRKAFREGKLTIDAVTAYASTPHQAAQEKQFRRGGYEANNAHHIRQSLIGDRQEIERLLKFVTPVAYKAAGGKMIEDLFADKDGAQIADFGLLTSLASKKIKEDAAGLVAKGWGWAADEDDLDSGAWYHWQRKAKPTAEEKKKLGVILRMGHNGSLEMQTGVIKPRTAGIKGDDEKSPGDKKKAKPAGALSNSLKEKLEQWRWIAVRLAIKNDTYPHGITETFAEIVGDLIRQHAPQHNPQIITKSFKDLVAGLHDKALQEALLKTFDPKEYFPKAPKPLVIKAINEAGFAEHAKKLVAGTKSAAWKFALSNLAKTGWLPIELRLGNYAGPGEGKKKPAAKASSKKKR